VFHHRLLQLLRDTKPNTALRLLLQSACYRRTYCLERMLHEALAEAVSARKLVGAACLAGKLAGTDVLARKLAGTPVLAGELAGTPVLAGELARSPFLAGTSAGARAGTLTGECALGGDGFGGGVAGDGGGGGGGGEGGGVKGALQQ